MCGFGVCLNVYMCACVFYGTVGVFGTECVCVSVSVWGGVCAGLKVYVCMLGKACVYNGMGVCLFVCMCVCVRASVCA